MVQSPEPAARRTRSPVLFAMAGLVVALAGVGVGVPVLLGDRDAGGSEAAPDPGAISSRSSPRSADTSEDRSGQQAPDSSRSPEAAPRGGPARFRVASFNVLGASHTEPGGDKPWFRPGPERMERTVRLLRARGVDLVGFQEYEPVQHRVFSRLTDGAFGVFPGFPRGRNSIAWRKDTWRLIETGTVTVPYFRGNLVRKPHVLLEHRATGHRLFVINVHNPASGKRRGDNQHWRDVAVDIETGLALRLHEQTGHPVLLTGDFNARERAFCRVTARAGMHAAGGGVPHPGRDGGAGGGCRPPADPGIDWIFGTDDVRFSGFQRQRLPVSDHPLLVADASLGSAPGSARPPGPQG